MCTLESKWYIYSDSKKEFPTMRMAGTSEKGSISYFDSNNRNKDTAFLCKPIQNTLHFELESMKNELSLSI